MVRNDLNIRPIAILIIFLSIIISGCISSKTQEIYSLSPCKQFTTQNIWKYVYRPYRLEIIEQCKIVTGKIANYVKEADGDYHIRLDVDNKSLINKGNIYYQHGYIVVEPICQFKPIQSDAIEPCKGYNGPYFNISHYIGKHLSITGSYVLDKDHHNWSEIHPVYDIKIIS